MKTIIVKSPGGTFEIQGAAIKGIDNRTWIFDEENRTIGIFPAECLVYFENAENE